ncbi:MAG: DASS family sodium-coupled anion symporter [Cruoricaptor ignavus]|nr:DASS family sodium-coupled anion symporter [Cruoricaptor ignavus]
MNRNVLIIITASIVSLLLAFFLPFKPMENKGLALLVLVAILWLTEAMHITATALMIPVLAVFLGISETKPALVAFADPTIFLFFGGFAIATALSVQKLDFYIANKVMALSNGNFFISIILLFTVTATLSMGISNTAAAAMMIPLAIGMLRQLDYKTHKGTFIFVILGIAYSANIGGMGTVIGSPPNAIVASQMKLTFADWLLYGMPFMIILMPLMILVLYLVFRPNFKQNIEINTSNEPLNKKQILTLVIFGTVSLCWILGGFLNPLFSGWLGIQKIESFDSIVALAVSVVICATGVANWKQIQEHTDWGVLMLFGGGLTLSAVLTNTGANKILVEGIVFLIEGKHFFWIGLLVATFVIFLTEFTSNTAAAALLVPLFISIATALDMNPLGLTMIVGLGASCAFMLPVATPPNAIAFGTGLIKQKDMLKAGFYLNIVSIILISIMAYLFWYH